MVQAEQALDLIVKTIASAVRAELKRDVGTSGAVTPRLLAVEQAAVYLGRTKASMQHLIAQKRIPVVREGRRVLLDIRELDRWIEANSEPAQS